MLGERGEELGVAARMRGDALALVEDLHDTSVGAQLKICSKKSSQEQSDEVRKRRILEDVEVGRIPSKQGMRMIENL